MSWTHYLSHETCWCLRTHPEVGDCVVAYFSAEFGLTECLSIFAGGLGMLAGDHLKSASDLGVPLVGVGLLYQQGYFRQYLNEAGWQQESYEDNDFHNLPLAPVRQPDGAPLTISVEFPGRDVVARVWRVEVGRVPLYLLDTNIPENPRPEDRDITDQLYGGDLEMRLKQEILLGIGGYRALEALGIAARRLPHERGPLGVPGARAHAPPDGGRAPHLRRGPRAGRVRDWSSPATRR